MLMRERTRNNPAAVFSVAVFVAVVVGLFVDPPIQTVIQAFILLLGGFEFVQKAIKAPNHQRFYIGLLVILSVSYVLLVNEGEHPFPSFAIAIAVSLACAR